MLIGISDYDNVSFMPAASRLLDYVLWGKVLLIINNYYTYNNYYSTTFYQCYSLFTIGYRLMSFNDCNDAASELMGVSLHVEKKRSI